MGFFLTPRKEINNCKVIETQSLCLGGELTLFNLKKRISVNVYSFRDSSDLTCNTSRLLTLGAALGRTLEPLGEPRVTFWVPPELSADHPVQQKVPGQAQWNPQTPPVPPGGAHCHQLSPVQTTSPSRDPVSEVCSLATRPWRRRGSLLVGGCGQGGPAPRGPLSPFLSRTAQAQAAGRETIEKGLQGRISPLPAALLPTPPTSPPPLPPLLL